MHTLPTLATLLALAGTALGQSTQRAAFVANNGNLEGSVTSYTFNAGQPVFVAKLVTGSTPSTSQPVPGTNATGITLTPDGTLLALSHATSSTTLEQIDIIRVNADATLTSVGIFQTPDSPLDLKWVNNSLLAVTETRGSGVSRVRMYRHDRTLGTLTPTDTKDVPGFMATIWASADGSRVFAPQTTTSTISVFAVDQGTGVLSLLTESPTGQFPIAPVTTAAADRLYCFGGISAGGTAIGAFNVNPVTGALTAIPGSPFVGGSSPKIGSISSNQAWLAVGHGTDATARLYAINPATGALTANPWVYDVGIQGDLGEVAFLDELILVTDRFNSSNGTGLLSFSLSPGGTVTPNGPVVSSQGITPDQLVTWSVPTPACIANCDGSTVAPVLNALDFSCFLDRYIAGDPYANCDGSTITPTLNALDFACFLDRYRAGCP